MTSYACKNDDHSLCHPKGKMLAVSGKPFKCSCDCHRGIDERPRWKVKKEIRQRLETQE